MRVHAEDHCVADNTNRAANQTMTVPATTSMIPI